MLMTETTRRVSLTYWAETTWSRLKFAFGALSFLLLSERDGCSMMSFDVKG